MKLYFIMITDLITDFLNRMLSDYFENFDTSQLNVSLWKGEAAFKNLRLKSNLLESLGLPFKIATGICGSLVLKLPWKAIFTTPIEISLQELYILVIPGTVVEIDEETIQKLQHELKMKIVEGVQAAQLYQQRLKEKEFLDHQDSRSYFEKLLLYLINNIQVEISSIHVRYEDCGSSRPNSKKIKTFSVGIILKKMSVETTDDKWCPGYISDHALTHYKLATIDGFAVYWNSDSEEVVKKFLNDQDRCTSLHNIINASNPKLKYVFGPLTVQTKLKLTPSPELVKPKPFSIPMVTVESIIVGELAITLTSQQFHDALYLLEKLDCMYRQLKWKKFRPSVASYKKSYKIWWRFAYDCTVESIRRRRSHWKWSQIKQHRQMCKDYHDFLCKKLSTKTAAEDVIDKVNELENLLDAFNIILVRNQVAITLQKKAQRDNVSSVGSGWFASWFSSSGAIQPEDTLQFLAHELSTDEKSNLFDAIGYREASVPVTFPPEYVELELQFNLDHLKIVAKADQEKRNDDILTVEIKKFKILVSLRPVNSGLFLKFLLGSIEILGLHNKAKIIRCRQSRNFFEIGYERFPLDSNFDQTVNVKGLPLEIVYNWKTIQELLNSFSMPSDISMNILQVKAAKKLVEWKAHSRAGLQHIIENRGKININCNLTAPNIIIPQNGEIRRARVILVIQLGSVLFYTKPLEHDLRGPQLFIKTKTPREIVSRDLRPYYETFAIELKEFKVYIKIDGINKQLVKSGEVQAKIDQCVVTNDHRFPQVKIMLTLSLVDLEITEFRLSHLIKLLTDIPIPELPTFSNSSDADSNDEVSDLKALTSITQLQASGKNLKAGHRTIICIVQVKVESFKISIAIE